MVATINTVLFKFTYELKLYQNKMFKRISVKHNSTVHVVRGYVQVI